MPYTATAAAAEARAEMLQSHYSVFVFLSCSWNDTRPAARTRTPLATEQSRITQGVHVPILAVAQDRMGEREAGTHHCVEVFSFGGLHTKIHVPVLAAIQDLVGEREAGTHHSRDVSLFNNASQMPPGLHFPPCRTCVPQVDQEPVVVGGDVTAGRLRWPAKPQPRHWLAEHLANDSILPELHFLPCRTSGRVLTHC